MQTTESTFEVFPYSRNQPSVTIRSRQIVLNSPAYSALERPEAVLLLFDSKNHQIGIKVCSPDDERSYPVNKHHKNNAVIPASAFIRHYGIEVEKSLKLNAHFSNGILIAML